MTNKLVVIINKVPKIKKVLPSEMKFLVPNYSCLQIPWLRATAPQIPILSVLGPQLNLFNHLLNKIPGYATGSNSAFYCVWFVVAFLMIDGCPFTAQKYLVSVALPVLISLHTEIRVFLYGDWACVHEHYQNTLKHKSRLLILLRNLLTLARMWQGNPWKTGDCTLSMSCDIPTPCFNHPSY